MVDRLKHGSVSMELTKHCNLKCARCDHTSPWFDESFASFDQFVHDFDRLTAVMEIDELRFSGGEALLHPRIDEFLTTAHEGNYARGLVLLSNGVLAHKLTDAGWKAIDVLQITVYPGIKLKVPAAELFERGQRFGTHVIIKNAPSFQQMLLNDPIQDDKLVRAIYLGCSAAVNCHTVFEGRFYRCSRAHLLEERLAMAGKTVANRAEDSVDLSAPDLRAALERYLGVDTPLLACSYCLGDHGKKSAHVQLRRKEEVEDEKRARHLDVQQLLDRDAELDPSRVARPLPNAPGWWEQADDAWEHLEDLVDEPA